MLDPQSTSSAAAVTTQLHEIAKLLRESDTLTPEARQALAEVVDELSQALTQSPTSSEETQRLAADTMHLLKALHERRANSVLANARDSLEQAVVRAEVEAPQAAGVVRRLMDALANVGI